MPTPAEMEAWLAGFQKPQGLPIETLAQDPGYPIGGGPLFRPVSILPKCAWALCLGASNGEPGAGYADRQQQWQAWLSTGQ